MEFAGNSYWDPAFPLLGSVYQTYVDPWAPRHETVTKLTTIP